MHQFEMVNGQARILVQTAAHVAGAAFFYQRRDVTEQPWPAVKKQCFYERKKQIAHKLYCQFKIFVFCFIFHAENIWSMLSPGIRWMGQSR